MHASFQLSDGLALGLHGVANSFEGKFDNILDVFPLVLALEEVVDQRWRIWISIYLHRIWVQIFKALRGLGGSCHGRGATASAV